MSERHAQKSHLTMGGTHPKPMSKIPSTHIWPCENTPHQNGSALISDHVRTHRIRMDLHLHMTSSYQKGSALTSNLILSERLCTYIRPHLVRKDIHLHLTSSCQKGSALTSNLILLERLCTYIRPHLVIKDLHLHLIMWEHIPQSHHNGSTLISDHVGTHPTITSEWLCTYIWSCGNTSCNHIKMELHLYLIMWEHIP